MTAKAVTLLAVFVCVSATTTAPEPPKTTSPPGKEGGDTRIFGPGAGIGSGFHGGITGGVRPVQPGPPVGGFGQFGGGGIGSVSPAVVPITGGIPQLPDVGQHVPGVPCSVFCRNPVQPYPAFVCCEKKAGACPTLRLVCPGIRLGPQPCYFDTQCRGYDKCCPDVCLPHKVCKPPSLF